MVSRFLISLGTASSCRFIAPVRVDRLVVRDVQVLRVLSVDLQHPEAGLRVVGADQVEPGLGLVQRDPLQCLDGRPEQRTATGPLRLPGLGGGGLLLFSTVLLQNELPPSPLCYNREGEVNFAATR